MQSTSRRLFRRRVTSSLVLPDRYVLGTVEATSDLHAVNLFWEEYRRERPELVGPDEEPIVGLKKRELRARMIPENGQRSFGSAQDDNL